MKRSLLTATSALVFTAAASAQTFQISGEVTVEVAYDPMSNMFNGPVIGAGGDDGIHLTFSGAGAGWEYQAGVDLLSAYWGDVELDHPVLGTFQLYQDHVEWQRDMLGEALWLAAYFQPADIVGSMTIGLGGNVAGVSYEANIMNDAPRHFELELGMPIMGVDLEAHVVGNLADTSTLDYDLGLGFDAFGVETFVIWNVMGDIAVQAEAGAFYAESYLTDGDFFNALTLGYQQEVTEHMEVEATVASDGTATAASAKLILRF